MVCNGAIYAIGGESVLNVYYHPVLDTVEKIRVEDLLSESCSGSDTKRWTTLDCRLSKKRVWCAAAVVHDRFIVVAGGGGNNSVASVDILDTLSSQTPCVVKPGPPLNVGRRKFGMAAIGQRVYAVGGEVGEKVHSCKSTVECLELDDWLKSESTSWTICKGLSLRNRRYKHGVVKVGSCLVVLGGGRHHFGSVEVLDTQRNIVWELPEFRFRRSDFSALVLLTGIVVIGDDFSSDRGEALSLFDKHSACFARLMALSKAPPRPQKTMNNSL